MPYTPAQPYVVAVVQLSPAFLDRDATIERACQAIADASARGARVVVFPEAFVPGYPLWVSHVASGRTHANGSYTRRAMGRRSGRTTRRWASSRG